MSFQDTNATPLTVIPKPLRIETCEGTFVISPGTSIAVDSSFEEAGWVGKYLAEVLSAPTGFNIGTIEAAETDYIILTTSDADAALGAEGYELTVNRNSVTVRAYGPAGLFYGVQTIRQLLPAAVENRKLTENIQWTIPCLRIVDKPRYSWRGLMLDVCRHFMPVESVKRFIDLMAMFKLNTFHWHLTEDQGWRIEIKKYPRLTETGAWRIEDGNRYGGFYTQDEVREVVQYAAERFITVVPEIELPGHAMAALTAYPEYSCTGGPFSVPATWGVFQDVYCAGNDATFSFLEDILGEVLELFPSKFFHIGGDECPKDRWKVCPKCQERIKAEGLADEHELQSYFIRRIEKFLNSRGKRLIGWDEILEGGLAPNATVMSWRGVDGGIAAAKQGHDVVMSPTSHCYFDYPYDSTPTGKVYSYEPVPEGLTEDEAAHILGAQANIWTEYIPDESRVDYMTFPRALALSEVVWTPAELRDWNSFEQRLSEHLKRLDILGVNYQIPPMTGPKED
ncbi:MAG: beta-N-acetylhexosaminidase [Armatimonadota bacterium]